MPTDRTTQETAKLAVPYLAYKLHRPAWALIKDLWDLGVNSQSMADFKRIFRPSQLLFALRRAGLWGAILIVGGLFVGYLGVLAKTDGVRTLGGIIRAVGVLWIASWAGVFAIKMKILVEAARGLSVSFDRLRSIAARLTSDFIAEDAIWTEGHLITEDQAKSIFNGILTFYVWIITLGTFTLFPSVIAIDANPLEALAFICVVIGLYVTSVILGYMTIQWARRFNIAAIIGLIIYFVASSPATGKVASMLKSEEAIERTARASCIKAYLKTGKLPVVKKGKKAQTEQNCQEALGQETLSAIKLATIYRTGKSAKAAYLANWYDTIVKAGVNGEYQVSALPDCADGVDNDGDGAADFDGTVLAISGDKLTETAGKKDSGCKSFVDTSEREKTLSCDDGEDNDGDGLVDQDDPSCWAKDTLNSCPSDSANCRERKAGTKTAWYIFAPSGKEEDSKKAPNASGNDKPAGAKAPSHKATTTAVAVKQPSSALQLLGKAADEALKVQ
jgi:hypothetical protein